LRRSEWLYRRVESIQFEDRGSVLRRVSVDLEVPADDLPALGPRAGKPTARLVPISTMPRWPPLSGFGFRGPDELATSLYLRETNQALDLGLLIGVIETVSKRTQWSDAQLLDRIAKMTAKAEPASDEVRRVTDGLLAELDAAIGAMEDEARAAAARTNAVEAVDLAARLGNHMILWVVLDGTQGQDAIVKFAYRDPVDVYRLGSHAAWKRLLIGCSWWQRTIDLWMPHVGVHSHYHLEVRSPSPGLELTSARLLALTGPGSAAAPTATAPASDGTQTLVTEYADIQDRRAVIYRGYRDAPSHRVLLRLRIAPSRQGFVTGCFISAALIAALMAAAFALLPGANRNLDSTVVLLAAAPVVLGYVLVRPGESAFERYHFAGVRMMALISGAMPIIGALALLLSHGDGTPLGAPTRDVWAGLLVVSWFVAAGLAMSVFYAVSPPGSVIGALEARLHPKSLGVERLALVGPFIATALIGGVVLADLPYRHVSRVALARFFVHERIRTLAGVILVSLAAVLLYGVISRLWMRLAPDRNQRRARRRFRWLVIYPGIAWIWTTVGLLALLAWLALTTTDPQHHPHLLFFSPWFDTVANLSLVPMGVFVIAATVRLAMCLNVLANPLGPGLIASAEAALVAVALLVARASSVLWPSIGRVAPQIAVSGFALWVGVLGLTHVCERETVTGAGSQRD
jgi:MFS family permease